MLSHIYNCSCKLQYAAKKTLKEVHDEDTATNIDLIRPSILLLHLMRIFYSICDNDEEKIILGNIITELEILLQVKNRTIPILPSPNISSISGLSTIINMATNAFKEVGAPLPDDFKSPTEDQINEIFTNLLNNESTKSLLQTVTNSLKNNNDIGSTIQSLLNSAMNPETLQHMQNSIIKTAEIAKENTLSPNKN